MNGCRGWRRESRGGVGWGGRVSLDCYIVSATGYEELRPKYGKKWKPDDFARRHILFPDARGRYLERLLAGGD